MTRIINIIGHGGSGKSFITLNLGMALSQKGKDVIVMDANIYSPDLANYSDIIPGVYLNDFLDGHKKIEDTITYHPSGMKMIHSIAEYEHNEKRHEKINQALLSLVGKSEIILVDNFSHNPAQSAILHNADETIFVANDDFNSIIKSKDFINKLENDGISVIGVILNKKRNDTNHKHVQTIINKPILGSLQYDEKVIDSINNKQPLFLTQPNSLLTKSFKDMADLLDLG